MLSRAERRFVDNPDGFSKRQQSLHRCRINKKIRKFASDLAGIVEKNDELGLSLQPLGTLDMSKGFAGLEQEAVNDVGKDSILGRLEDW